MTLNNLSGDVPCMRNCSSLRALHVYSNKLNGLSECTWELSNLEVLDFARNMMNGTTISDAQLSNLTKLVTLDHVFLSDCEHKKNLAVVSISRANILDIISNWFWELPIKLSYLDLSENQISGDIQKPPQILDDFCAVNLSSNLFQGSIPRFPANVTALSLSSNMLTGTTSSLCSMSGGKLTYLDLSNNLLSGELSDCWFHWKKLSILNLQNNNFSGRIPGSFGSLLSLQALHLSSNSFSGELPPALRFCQELDIIDVGENQLTGRLPTWLEESLSKLTVMHLRSNRFHGGIPWQLCYLTSVQILDLSNNNLSGIIPDCLNNFTYTADTRGILETFYHNVTSAIGNGMPLTIPYVDNVMVVWKGMAPQYGETLGLVKSVDLSSNNLSWEIHRVVALNLSRNQLIGFLPPTFGNLRALQSLDLSQNQLSGELPGSLQDLNYLSLLNVSYNNLSGKIPQSTQLQSLDSSGFMGNPKLCGKPLPNMKLLQKNQHPSVNQGSKDDVGDDEIFWVGFYVSAGIGFFTAFGLLLKRSWRHDYFNLMDNIGRWLYVRSILFTARLSRRHGI
ncbi:hypothetical protein Tsubulata_041297 [Turnera subulata]|uniref:Leucine-rich repeat-containing N-terminal plant-type domain-containing protein n=1 Tax=Turnera subulata TaxID=218843 RepID=A0A9Q0IYU4_9ROSI|nr:hypothetical protein Tsubulata_041297 [Turnera subulata]